MKTIHTIGDSHAVRVWNSIPGVVIHYRGAQTMYRFGQNKEIVVKNIPEDDIVIYCMGEIDCRCHVHKHQPWQENIEMLVKNYLDAIRLNNHKNSWIFNIVPPPRKTQTFENSAFPFVGTDEERLSYVWYMNRKLSESGFVFVDVYDKYSDPEGFMRMDLSDGHVHIEKEEPLIEWISARGDK